MGIDLIIIIIIKSMVVVSGWDDMAFPKVIQISESYLYYNSRYDEAYFTNKSSLQCRFKPSTSC